MLKSAADAAQWCTALLQTVLEPAADAYLHSSIQGWSRHLLQHSADSANAGIALKLYPFRGF